MFISNYTIFCNHGNDRGDVMNEKKIFLKQF